MPSHSAVGTGKNFHLHDWHAIIAHPLAMTAQWHSLVRIIAHARYIGICIPDSINVPFTSLIYTFYNPIDDAEMLTIKLLHLRRHAFSVREQEYHVTTEISFPQGSISRIEHDLSVDKFQLHALAVMCHHSVVFHKWFLLVLRLSWWRTCHQWQCASINAPSLSFQIGIFSFFEVPHIDKMK